MVAPECSVEYSHDELREMARYYTIHGDHHKTERSRLALLVHSSVALYCEHIHTGLQSPCLQAVRLLLPSGHFTLINVYAPIAEAPMAANQVTLNNQLRTLCCSCPGDIITLGNRNAVCNPARDRWPS